MAGLRGIDLFSGAGGMSEGARSAGVRTVWAGNHWRAACDVYAKNHLIQPVCQDLRQADWRKVPGHDVLLASPACTGHSPARGKERPHHDAMRSTAWAVVDCVEYHRPPFVVVENVREFQKWSLYPAWALAMERLGYSISPLVIDAADHGVPQNRVRLFAVCTRSKAPITVKLEKREHRPIAEVIDWNSGSWSKIDRPGRKASTLARVASGRSRFGERFVMPYYSSGSGLTGRSIHRPIGTITTKARWAVVDGNMMRMLSVNEARLAMGLRTNYVLPETDAAAMMMLGNGVAPEVVTDLMVSIQRCA